MRLSPRALQRAAFGIAINSRVITRNRQELALGGEVLGIRQQIHVLKAHHKNQLGVAQMTTRLSPRALQQAAFGIAISRRVTTQSRLELALGAAELGM